MMQIVLNAPFWVWPLFVGLLVLGLVQTRSRTLSRTRVLAVPAALMAFSLYGIVTSFGVDPLAVGAWLAGVTATAVLNEYLFLSPRGVRYLPDSRKFAVPGSFVPLILIMAIFWSRFAFAATTAVMPSIASDLRVIILVSAGLGLASGYFLTRAMRILRSTSAR